MGRRCWNMPEVIINCAMSADGKIALPSRVQTRISSDEDLARVHDLRSRCDAILVGIGTILADDPSLTVKKEFVEDGRDPLRVVLDSGGRTPDRARVLSGGARTLIFTVEGVEKEWPGATKVQCGSERVDLPGMLSKLDGMGVRRLLVEGGSEVIWSFLSEKLADRLVIYVGSIVIGGSSSPTPAGGEGFPELDETVRLRLENVSRLGDGVLLDYLVVK